MGRQLCTNKAPVVNEQINQQKRWEKKKNKRKKKKKKPGRDEGKHEKEKRAKSDGVHGINAASVWTRLQLSGSPSMFGS